MKGKKEMNGDEKGNSKYNNVQTYKRNLTSTTLRFRQEIQTREYKARILMNFYITKSW